MDYIVPTSVVDFSPGSDPVFAALKTVRDARELHSQGLRNVDEALLSSRNSSTQSMIAWDLYRLQDLEAEEATAALALLMAERMVLNTAPTSLAGCIAVLHFLQAYLKNEPDIAQTVNAIGNVAAPLSTAA